LEDSLVNWSDVLSAPAGMQRRLAFLLWLERRVRDLGGVSPFLVGRVAVEIYTQGGYSTGDIDLKCQEQPFSSILADVGFSRRGRVWVHLDADLWVDRVGEAPEEPYEIASSAVELRLLDGRVRMIAPEDLVLDRLRAAVRWKDEDGLLWGEAIVRSAREMGRSFDWRSVERRLEDEDERDALGSLMSRSGITIEVEGERADGPTP
jgi:hypothetical protein